MTGRKGLLWGVCLGYLITAASCSILKPTSKNNSPATTKNTGNRQQIEFLEGITTPVKGGKAPQRDISKNITMSSAMLENAQEWQFKYAQLLDVPVETVLNSSLYSFIDDWWGTPYRLGGKDKAGIDCSGFANLLLSTVFNENASGTSAELYDKTKRINAKQLKEGDFVFFKISGKKVSHVGIYLDNDHFVHASTSAGVMISDLNEAYWKKYYAGGGRLQ